MRALFRYAFLKSFRDHSLVALTVMPGLMLAAPMLGLTVLQILRGHARYPMSIDLRTTPESTAYGLTNAAVIMSIVMAGIAGFWLFRVEIGDRSIGTMVMAARARMITAVATLHAAVVGTSAFMLCLALVALFTAHVPETVPRLFLVVVGATVAAGASGILVATISAETPMAVPVLAASMVIAAYAINATPSAVILISATVSFLFVLAAGILMERRCAA